MQGGRITVEEKTSISIYVGVGVLVALAAGALYFFFLAQKEKHDTFGFDPKRAVPSDAVLQTRLTPEQFNVVRRNAGETPFQNAYWNNDHKGIYVDLITGEPLFSSRDKYDSGLGLPAFSKPVSYDVVVENPDHSEGMDRIEIRAKRSDAHLGHLFADPKSRTGRRYSIQSAALRFIPLERMKDDGYGNYLSLVETKPAASSAGH